MGRRGTLTRAYAALALLGAILPYSIFIPWVAEHGFVPAIFFRQPFVNGPAAIFSADVLFSALVFLLFAAVEGRRLGIRPVWLPLLVTATIGLCCALPLFLSLRERALSQQERA